MRSSVLPTSHYDQSLAVEISDDFAIDAPESDTRIRVCASVTRADIEPYMHLVHQAVARMLRRVPPSVQRDDLVSAATFGLMDALRKHAGERGPEFEWYARVRIRGAIFDELRSLDWLSRGARAEITAALEAEEDSRVSGTVVVGFEDLPEGRRSVAPPDQESPLDLAERNSERRALGTAVAKLPEREAQIVNLHYFQGVQFKEIAQILGVSEPRISQLHARAMKMLKEILAADAAAVMGALSA